MEMLLFDFGGCGLSEDGNEKMNREWRMSLGVDEKVDLDRVIEEMVMR